MIVKEYKKAITSEFIPKRENLRADFYEFRQKEQGKFDLESDLEESLNSSFNIVQQIFMNNHKLFDNLYLYLNPELKGNVSLDDYKSSKLNAIRVLEANIELNIDSLNFAVIFIKDLLMQDRIEEAKKLQNFIILLIDKVYLLLLNSGINLSKIQQSDKLEELKKEILNSINIKELLFENKLRPSYKLLFKALIVLLVSCSSTLFYLLINRQILQVIMSKTPTVFDHITVKMSMKQTASVVEVKYLSE